METIAFEDYVLSNERPYLTVGMFDGVHCGHRSLLQELVGKAHSHGSKAVVVSFTSHPRQVLNATDGGFALLQDCTHRQNEIASCGVDCLLWLDFTAELASMEASEFLDMLIAKVNPCQVLVGYDNRFGRKGSREFEDIIAEGRYKDVIVRRSETKVLCEGVEVSSTQIRKALGDGNVSLAAKMLSKPYSLSGIVESGRQIGRRIGFPTANVRVESGFLLPKDGVYAVKVSIDGRVFGGVLNLGHKPTIDKQERTIEVHVFDFSEQIYDKSIEIAFIEYLRSQQKFESLDDLKAQIEKDCEDAKLKIGLL